MLSMRTSFFGAISTLIFLGVGLIHGLRAYYEMPLILGAWSVPIWVSWSASFVGFIMAFIAARTLR